MLGIGSGINCVMLAVQWQATLVGSRGPCPEWAVAAREEPGVAAM
jgi:hypothetical protein